MRLYGISFLTVILYSLSLASSSNTSDILHSFILEIHNDTSRPITILQVTPSALIKKHDVIDAYGSSHMLILPHTTIRVLFNHEIYEIHIRSKEKHPAVLTFRYSHRSYPVIEPKNIKLSTRKPKDYA